MQLNCTSVRYSKSFVTKGEKIKLKFFFHLIQYIYVLLFIAQRPINVVCFCSHPKDLSSTPMSQKSDTVVAHSLLIVAHSEGLVARGQCCRVEHRQLVTRFNVKT